MIYFNAVGLPELDASVACRLFEESLQNNLGMLLGSQTPHWLLTGRLQPGQRRRFEGYEAEISLSMVSADL